MKTLAMGKDELNKLIELAHPYIKDIVRIYGEQGCRAEICPKCWMIIKMSYQKGRGVGGPVLDHFMMCRHKK